MNRIPLAERMRPKNLSEVIGQDEIVGDNKILTEIAKKSEPVNLIFWGPPGTGKTTLARILAHEFNADFVEISAVTAGKKDVETVVERARVNWNLGTRTVLFVDEIHRFNKAQQDAFLPHVESGLITLIGATTENPSFEVISPLLSRSRVVIVKPLSKSAILEILSRACSREGITIGFEGLRSAAARAEAPAAHGDSATKRENLELARDSEQGSDVRRRRDGPAGRGPRIDGHADHAKQHGPIIDDDALNLLADLSGGDARAALGDLELAMSLSSHITKSTVIEAAGKKLPGYDKSGDHHYDNISAFIKSMRGSDVDAALYYLARMVNAGEDPKFIARRMVIFASEDIGLAASGALNLATTCFEAVERIGMPESGLILAHVTVALAKCPKSRATTDAWYAAIDLAKKTRNEPVPIWLRNAPTKLMKDLGFGQDQQWTAGFHLNKNYLPDSIKDVKLWQAKSSSNRPSH